MANHMAAHAGASERVVVRPADTGAALVNPGMGWVSHYYDNSLDNYGSHLEPSDTLDDFPGLSVIYFRLPWSFLEPEEGEFDWSLVDAPALRWTLLGKQIALRFTCSETSFNGTPDWVREAGAKGHDFTPPWDQADASSGPHLWEPDFDDPIFLQKLDGFLAAAASRYDGNPQVAFVDVGSFGVWGEGHTWWSTRLHYSSETVRRHIALHLKHFRKTLLVANDDFADHGRDLDGIDYAFEQGLTLRDDSILVQGGEDAYFNAPMAQRFWPRVPVILESEHYGHSKSRGVWGDGAKYLQAVEDYHASYGSIHWWPREFLAENRDLVNRINLRLGYRLQLIEASWPERAAPGDHIHVEAVWRNAGVAPCYPGGHPALTLKDEAGGVVAVFTDEGFDLRSLPVGPPGEADKITQTCVFRVPQTLKPGRYEVFISADSSTRVPTLALPLANDDGQRRYRLGLVEVVSRQ